MLLLQIDKYAMPWGMHADSFTATSQHRGGSRDGWRPSRRCQLVNVSVFACWRLYLNLYVCVCVLSLPLTSPQFSSRFLRVEHVPTPAVSEELLTLTFCESVSDTNVVLRGRQSQHGANLQMSCNLRNINQYQYQYQFKKISTSDEFKGFESMH